MRVVFMGTPDFAVPCLTELLRAGHQVLAVVTQPDRPKGRGHMLAPSPVKIAAIAANLRVLQPLKVRDGDFLKELHCLNPDVIIVVAYGQILPLEILNTPTYGCINVHASLLPKYRGAAPIHRSIIDGEKSTGVTTMLMDKGLDTGDMLLKAETPVYPEDTAGTLHDRLMHIGASLLLKTLAELEKGNLQRIPQDDTFTSYAAVLTRADELINWQTPSNQIVNRIRGLNPWPGAYTSLHSREFKIWQAEEVSEAESEGKSLSPGTISKVNKNSGFQVQSGDGLVLVKEVQPQGGKRMNASAFARGYGLAEGQVIGK